MGLHDSQQQAGTTNLDQFADALLMHSGSLTGNGDGQAGTDASVLTRHEGLEGATVQVPQEFWDALEAGQLKAAAEQNNDAAEDGSEAAAAGGTMGDAPAPPAFDGEQDEVYGQHENGPDSYGGNAPAVTNVNQASGQYGTPAPPPHHHRRHDQHHQNPVSSLSPFSTATGSSAYMNAFSNERGSSLAHSHVSSSSNAFKDWSHSKPARRRPDNEQGQRQQDGVNEDDGAAAELDTSLIQDPDE